MFRNGLISLNRAVRISTVPKQCFSSGKYNCIQQRLDNEESSKIQVLLTKQLDEMKKFNENFMKQSEKIDESLTVGFIVLAFGVGSFLVSSVFKK